MTHLRVELPDEVAAALTRLAAETGSTPETLLAEAAAGLLAEREAMERAIAEGEADAEAGRVVGHDEVMREMEAWAAGLRAKAQARR